MPESAVPEKWEWTDADFEEMSWHDCSFRGFAVLDLYSYGHDEGNLVAFDLDYILEWVPKDNTYLFWIAPATLLFHNAHEVDIKVNWSLEVGDQTTVYELERRNEGPSPFFPGSTDWEWYCELFTLRASGFTQYIRRPPILVDRQILTETERGGISFALGRES